MHHSDRENRSRTAPGGALICLTYGNHYAIIITLEFFGRKKTSDGEAPIKTRCRGRCVREHATGRRLKRNGANRPLCNCMLRNFHMQPRARNFHMQPRARNFHKGTADLLNSPIFINCSVRQNCWSKLINGRLAERSMARVLKT